MVWQDRIVVDPQILVGKPVVKGTRLSMEFIIGLLAAGWSEEEILASYPASPAMTSARALPTHKTTWRMSASVPSPSEPISNDVTEFPCSATPSRDTDGFQGVQDLLAANVILAAQDRFAFHQINGTPQDPRQLLFHDDDVEEAPPGVGYERDQHVYIAVGAKVPPQDRAE